MDNISDLILFVWKYIIYELNLTTILLALTSVLVILNIRRRPGLPPGPRLFPIVGNLLSLSPTKMIQTLRGFRERYGDIYSLYIGNEIVIFLNGYEAIYNAAVKRGGQFLHRPPSVLQKIGMNRTGIIYSNGNLWKEQKSFVQKNLHALFIKNGAQNMEFIIGNEVDVLLNEIELAGDGDLDPAECVHTCALNVMFQITHGRRFSTDVKDLKEFALDIQAIAKHVAKMQLLANCFPFLVKLPWDLLESKRRLELVKKTHDYTRQFVGPYQADREHTNLADAFNEHIHKQTSVKGENTFTEDQREDTLTDFIAAGGDTTATAIMWTIVHLVRNPSVQENMYKEIVNVLGYGHKPSYSERKSLPYTEAVILEGLRIGETTALALPHSVITETAFNGYVFPKDSTVIFNLESVLKDPDIWNEPERFDPERFLNHDRSEVLVPKEFIPFLTGPRSCLGDIVAKMEVFDVISALVMTFKLVPKSDGRLPETRGEMGITFRPQPFEMRFQKRDIAL
ncbi:cytochrome P450 2U1-like [Mya arenaria]|uniref:cytochrome P450 2U1-like n=1 Tax=Mya arenaria TaxID=6604 RepID=UPI0022DEF5A4|nr:cytochrome P450 2U1-like [Mya arenaria]